MIWYTRILAAALSRWRECEQEKRNLHTKHVQVRTCINTLGSFACGCKTGYQLSTSTTFNGTCTGDNMHVQRECVGAFLFTHLHTNASCAHALWSAHHTLQLQSRMRLQLIFGHYTRHQRVFQLQHLQRKDQLCLREHVSTMHVCVYICICIHPKSSKNKEDYLCILPSDLPAQVTYNVYLKAQKHRCNCIFDRNSTESESLAGLEATPALAPLQGTRTAQMPL